MSRTFPGSPIAIAEARRFVTTLLGSRPGIEDAELIVSELATNAVRHSASGRFGGCFTVAVQADRDRIWLGVLDQGGLRAPHPLPPQEDDEGGRGLALVAAMAASWGVTGDEQGRIVWAALNLAPQQTAAR
ncbi:ATP-binding protein [Streptosporangium sandarakinum]|uniref:Anti-sigma regulatory factor (Ser/Thr protein kinase) n=1 Tax=Streptosporangium sandarakinum TaxID=1260955 RepID=A0A852V0Y7_9ACTN|nr:ATP-binding protein [Streptosporangium sandarakinum]NYF40934.1 anti-sigma regulatory factor (Ser/Thr protein kinase) [Streptosporangium sandarakinum]